nr:unnamed protein product [Haemonchus contortus]
MGWYSTYSSCFGLVGRARYGGSNSTVSCRSCKLISIGYTIKNLTKLEEFSSRMGRFLQEDVQTQRIKPFL